VAVLTDTRQRSLSLGRALERAAVPVVSLEDYEGQRSPGVLVGTFHRAKGLEFKEVFIPRLGDDQWPARGLVSADLPEEERRVRRSLQLRALHVAMSRARDRLFLTCTGSPCAPIKGVEDLLDVSDYR
jgi:superfamily I DNA/RNA helicase